MSNTTTTTTTTTKSTTTRKPRAAKPAAVVQFEQSTVDAQFTEFGKRARQHVVNFKIAAEQEIETMRKLIATRVQTLIDNNQAVAAEWSRIDNTLSNESFPNALAVLMGARVIDVAGLVDIIGNTREQAASPAHYVQAKTVEKWCNMVFTLASNDLHKLSDYTSQVIFAALHNGSALSIDGARAALSKRCSRVDLPRREEITNPANYTVGTASSQASQVRDLLRVLGLAAVNKGGRGDVFEIHPDKVAALRALYA
jgi:hypothetical protein